MARKTAKRTASPEFAAKVYQETKSIAAVARRISYSYVGAARLLHRAGVVRSKTARSR